MGEVLPFLTRDLYETARQDATNQRLQTVQATADPVAPAEFVAQSMYAVYREETLVICNRLVEFYQHTGRWSPQANDKMKHIVQELLMICTLLSRDTLGAPIDARVGTNDKGPSND